ncbi:hypothetical protein [Neobacillus sp. FSL H8-0543]|uniref:hypothetical protein n=1 Tax=Neobacillus sp. FSL H8-0543 TaxID=2954672 RepID=UPI0031588D9B
MENNISDKLKDDLLVLNKDIGDKNSKLLNVNQLIRVIKRLESFSGECKECEKYLIELNRHIENFKKRHGQHMKLDFKEHQKKVNEIISHFQKEHKLISDGYYLSIYISIGTSLGLVYGLLFSDNLSLGLSFGLGIGVAIGASLDADAKKKGLMI